MREGEREREREKEREKNREKVRSKLSTPTSQRFDQVEETAAVSLPWFRCCRDCGEKR